MHAFAQALVNILSWYRSTATLLGSPAAVSKTARQGGWRLTVRNQGVTKDNAEAQDFKEDRLGQPAETALKEEPDLGDHPAKTVILKEESEAPPKEGRQPTNTKPPRQGRQQNSAPPKRSRQPICNKQQNSAPPKRSRQPICNQQ